MGRPVGVAWAGAAGCGLCGLCGDYSPWTASASAWCSLCTSGSGIDPAEALPAGPGLLGRWAAAALVRERERERQRERGRARGIRGHPPSDDGLDNLPDHTHTLCRRDGSPPTAAVAVNELECCHRCGPLCRFRPAVGNGTWQQKRPVREHDHMEHVSVSVSVCVCVCVCRCLELEVSRERQRGEKVSSVVFAGRSVWIVPHITPPSRAFARLSSVHSSRRDPCFGGFCFSDLPAPDRGLSRTSRAALISLAGHVQSMDIFGRAHRAATFRYTVPKPGGGRQLWRRRRQRLRRQSKVRSRAKAGKLQLLHSGSKRERVVVVDVRLWMGEALFCSVRYIIVIIHVSLDS